MKMTILNSGLKGLVENYIIPHVITFSAFFDILNFVIL